MRKSRSPNAPHFASLTATEGAKLLARRLLACYCFPGSIVAARCGLLRLMHLRGAVALVEEAVVPL